MRTIGRALLVIVVLCVPFALAAPQEEVPAVEADAEAEWEVGARSEAIPMAEVLLDKETVRGRVLLETDDVLRLSSFGKGVIGLRIGAAREIRRFDLPPAVYFEEMGDFHQQRAWSVDDGATEFVKARQAYMNARRHARGQAERLRIQERLDHLAAERLEWQEEALRREELRRAQEQTELIRVQKKIAEEQLEAGRRHERYIEDLVRAVADLDGRLDRVSIVLEALSDDMEDLEDDVSTLSRRDRSYVSVQVFQDLKRSHDSLSRDVDRLRRGSSRD